MAVLRRFSTSRSGSNFDQRTVELVWQKATVVPGVDARVRRKDRCGAWIDRAAYGQTSHHGTGWEIDHICPVSQGGSDDLNNLQPLQWENNRCKSDNYPAASFCAVSAAR